MVRSLNLNRPNEPVSSGDGLADTWLVDLPPTAIGKDYLGARLVDLTPSGTGAQFNLFGLAGVLVGLHEGIELNVIGLTFGLNPARLALKLPLLGNIGLGGPVEPRRLPAQTRGRAESQE